MHVHPTEASAAQSMHSQELQNLCVLNDRNQRQRGKQAQYFIPTRQRTTSQLANDEGMRPGFAGLEVAGQPVTSVPEVIDPDRCVDEHADSAGARTSARHGPQGTLCPAECREPPCTLATDERAQTRVNHRRFFLKTAQPAGVGQQFFVQDEGGTHMHNSASVMHIMQAPRGGPIGARISRCAAGVLQRCDASCQFVT